jgi:phospholipase D1/2
MTLKNSFSSLLLKVKEWLQNLGIGEHMPVVHDDEEADDVHVLPHHDDHSAKSR